VGVQIVLYEHDLFGVLEVGITDIFENVRVVDRGTPLRDLDVAPTFQRRKQHEQVCGTVALVLVVVARRLPRPHRDRRARLGDELLGCLIKTDEWSRRIMRARINLEHILHGRDKRRIGGGWDHPIFLQMRLDIVFFKARPTVLKCAAATISRSTTVSASRRSVQRA
jgi:hypothetical protein